jgi:hypothetical protein
MNRFTFAFQSNYQGQTDFMAFDRQSGAQCRVRLVNATGEARLMSDPVPAEMLQAFNDWRRAKYDSDIAYIGERYGAAALADVEPFKLARAA